MSNHTPGPWETHFAHDVTGYPCYFIHGMSGEQKYDHELHAAYARLISAAPELLAVCQALLNVFPVTVDDIIVEGLHDMAKAAIAKATPTPAEAV